MPYNYYFDSARICANGHVQNIEAKNHAERNSNFCSECSAKIISECLYCHTSIKGAYLKQQSYTIRNIAKSFHDEPETRTHTKIECLTNQYTAPSYCHNCGNPYPQTEAILKNGEAIVDILEELTPEQKKT